MNYNMVGMIMYHHHYKKLKYNVHLVLLKSLVEILMFMEEIYNKNKILEQDK